MDLLKESLSQYEYIGYENIECKVFYDILSKEECQEWIKDIESREFEPALISDGGKQVLDTSIRSCERVFVDNDSDKLELLKDRIDLSCLPGTGHELNPRLRCLKYYPGQYFRSHYDASYTGIEGKHSEWTIQLYLNDDFKGGETVFMQDYGRWKIPFKPKAGAVILFCQSLLHEGSKVTEGIKYSVRTDVLVDND
jgi:prolyl 4-hydroxylase